MKVNLSCFGQSPCPERFPKEDPGCQNVCLMGSIIKFLKPSCLCADKNKGQTQRNEHDQYQQLKEGTLEELLFASSGEKEDNISTNHKIFEHIFKKNSRSLAEDYAGFNSKPRDSFSSLEMLLKIDEEIDNGETDVSWISRSSSGKEKKRVSFKLPPEAEIIIFYSPEVDCKED